MFFHMHKPVDGYTDTMSRRSLRFFGWAVLFEVGLGVVAVLIGRLFGLRFDECFAVDTTAIGWAVGATVPTLLFYVFLRSLPWTCLHRIREQIRSIFLEEMNSLTVWHLALLALAAGFGEEFLFRGLFQKGLCNMVGRHEPIIVVLISVLFGLCHCLSKTYVVLAFLISLYLGFLFLETNNLFVPMMVHALYDFCVFLHLRYECSRLEERTSFADKP